MANEDAAPKRELFGHNGYVGCVKFRTETGVITASGDKSCINWDIETGKPVRQYTGHSLDVVTLSVSRDQTTFLSAGCDGIVRMWDTRQAPVVSTFSSHAETIWCVQHFPNDLCFATSGEDSSVKLFDIRAANSLATYKLDNSMNEGSTGVAFSSSGRIMFANDGSKIVAWDVVKVKPITTFNNSGDKISAIAMAPNGCAFVASSWDKSLYLYA